MTKTRRHTDCYSFLLSRQRRAAFIALFLLVVSSVQSQAAVPSGIEVTLASAQSRYSATDKIYIQVSYHNVTNQPIRFLTWGTALEGRINDDILSVTHEGVDVPYSGRHYKRAAPQPSDYVIIEPESSLDVTVDLLTGYSAVYQGEYTILPRGSGAALSTFAKRKPLTITLTNDRVIAFKQTPIFSDCSSSRQTLIDSALSAAESITRRARDDLRNTPVSQRANARRYQEWFGTYTESRWNRVQRNFDAIYAAVSGRRITFTCDDSSSAYAYVFSGDPYKIYLGNAFWPAPRTGTDSKSGTIVHELSHFNVVAATDDVVYGQSGARNLARTNPGNAIRNADSHEYFAENTPNLSMPSPAPAEAPDLVVASVTLTRSELPTSAVFGVSTQVRNGGNAASVATQVSVKLSTDSRITTSDSETARVPVSALQAGSVENLQVDLSAPADEGEYWVGVCVLPVSGEQETGNNCSFGVPLLVKKPTLISPILLLLMDD